MTSDLERRLSYFSLIFVLFISSGASKLSIDKNLIITGWIFFTCAYFYIVRMLETPFVLLTAACVAISIIYYWMNGGYDEVTYLGLFLRIYLAYYCRSICKEHFFAYFINIMFVLTCIALPLYIFQLINFDFLFKVNNFFGEEPGYRALPSSLIFTLAEIHRYRNCGFMWEPGAFAAVLIVTIYINTFRQKEPLHSRRNIIFIIAILTTQSTMGCLSLLIPISLVLYQAIQDDKRIRQLSFMLIPTVVAIFIVIFSQVDFLSKKITEEYSGLDAELAFIAQGDREHFIVEATRLASVTLDMETIKQYPLLGLGVDMYTTGENKMFTGLFTVTACGLSLLVVRFGLIGLVVYFYLFYTRSFFEDVIHRIGWLATLFLILYTNELSTTSFIHLFIF